MQIIDQDLRCDQGTSFNQRVEIFEGQAAVNLLGRTFSGQVRAKAGGILVAVLTVSVADQATSPGVFFIQLSAAQTKAMPMLPSPEGYLFETNFVYSVFATYSNGQVDPVMRGRFIVKASS